jgi:uncharacterized membrane protein
VGKASEGSIMKIKLWVLGAMAVFVMTLTTLILSTAPYNPILDFKIHRFLHILGAVMFLGNIITGAMWMIVTDVTGSPSMSRFSIRAINIADLIFTGPGVILLVLNGAFMATNWNGLWSAPWLKWSLILFILIGVLWSFILVPLQIKFENTCEDKDVFMSLYVTSAFRELLVAYFVAGSITIILALVILFLMVSK